MPNLEISRALRLDQYVISQFPALSRGFATRLIEEGRVQVNGQPIIKAGYKLRGENSVVIDYTPEEAATVPTIDLPIIYEDDDCVVINKPVGVLTHSKGVFNPEATVATWLQGHLFGATGSSVDEVRLDMQGNRAGIVHRLDRLTSGVMICAKTLPALSHLQKQFSQRKTKKTYLAIVAGRPELAEAVIDMPIERNPKAPATFRVGPNGKSATTHYRVLCSTQDMSLLELKPETGRTHQLRVHLKQLGYPIVGDVLYGGAPAGRMYLHASSLEITVPSSQRRIFKAATPAGFAALVPHSSDEATHA